MAYDACLEDAKLLMKLSPKERKAILKVLVPKQVRSICECAYNLLRGNIRSKDRSKLRKHKAVLRRLAKRGEYWVTKRKYLVQKGGEVLIPLLLGTVLQVALSKFNG